MAKSPTLYGLGYFLVIGTISWILSFFPESSINITYQFVARMLLSCMIGYYTWPLLKRFFFNQKISPQNKAVLITGCDSGFGHNLAKRLDSKGFHVFASCLFPSGDGARILRETCSKSLQVLSLDVTKDESVHDAFVYVKQHLNGSKLWAVVNNAGIVKGFEIEWTKLEDFQEVMDVNAMGVVRVTKTFLPLLRKSKGRVVTVTSLSGRFTTPSMAPYCMSKFAASCFCECLRQEMYPWGVKVVAIEPDVYRTPIVNWNAIESRLDDSVRNLDAVTKEDYGDRYFEEYKKAAKRMLQIYSPRIYKVIDCLEDAVMLQEPCNVYRPRVNIFLKLFFGLAESLPKSFTDFISRGIQSHFLGFRNPRGSEQKF